MSTSNRGVTRALYAAVTATAMLLATSGAFAQDQAGTAIVSIYRVAPGKHLAFLQWMAAREAAASQAGVPATRWYRHIDGDSWDYVAIAPGHDDAIDAKADAIARQQGLAVGMKAGLELRGLMASHTDTVSAGPFTAAQMVQEASQP